MGRPIVLEVFLCGGHADLRTKQMHMISVYLNRSYETRCGVAPCSFLQYQREVIDRTEQIFHLLRTPAGSLTVSCALKNHNTSIACSKVCFAAATVRILIKCYTS